MMIKTFFACIMLVCLSSPSFADTYKWVDENGTLHFGDQPHKDPTYKVERKKGADKKTLSRKKYYSEESRRKIKLTNRRQRIPILQETTKLLYLRKEIDLKLALVSENSRSLEFYVEFEYRGKENAGYIGMRALSADRTKSYLIHQKPWVPVKPGRHRKYFTLKHWGERKGSNRTVEMTWLQFFVYDSGNKVNKYTYERFIPFKKSWIIPSNRF